MDKRGYTYSEAMAYVGVKRRTFDEKWRPHLVAMQQGSSLVYDRADLDRLFERFKAEAAGVPAANDDQAQNGPRNGRPSHTKGETLWARKQPASTVPETTGKSTSGGEALGFANVASLVMKKQKAGLASS